MTSGGADADGSQSTEGSTAGGPDEEEGGGRETHAGGCGSNDQYKVGPAAPPDNELAGAGPMTIDRSQITGPQIARHLRDQNDLTQVVPLKKLAGALVCRTVMARA